MQWRHLPGTIVTWDFTDGAVILFVYTDYDADYSFVCRQRVLVGHWPDWRSSAIVLAAMSGRSDAGPDGLRGFFPREKLRSPVNFMPAAGAYSWHH